ncbi:MAG: threonine ammonia-lyase [Eubacteriales bacterium]|nr:threonine ammonia-lyase [Eubacteriales bacterium]
MLTLDMVYQAAHTSKNTVRKTDLIPATGLDSDCRLYLKAENLQLTGSFKLRGAYYKISSLSKEEKEKGVVACSAGNHAQGVALAAQRSGIKATIFLPSVAPISKVEATKKYGAETKIIDGVYDDAYEAAVEYQKETGAVFIHPFEDEQVIAGQGTIGLELIDQLQDMDAVVVPIGGGGLISGISFVIKKLNPKCKVYGVQAEGASSMCRSMHENSKCSVSCVSTFADGIAVKSPGQMTYDFCKENVDDVVTVSDDEIATAILALMEKEKLVAEGAGAVAVAAIMFGKLPVKNKKVCAIVSGGNIDVNILSRVINRGLLMSGRLSDLNIELLDKPGQLREVAAIIADTGANVTKVSHNQGGENTDIRGCYLRVSMETRNKEHLDEIKEAFRKAGYKLHENI